MSKAPRNHDAGGKDRPAWPENATVKTVFSDCGQYRYQLREIWDTSKPLVLWVMMNPSVACVEYSDRSLRKTGKFARSWGYGGQLIGNVCAYRATDNTKLLEVADPTGPENDQKIKDMADEAELVVLAHGHLPSETLRNRAKQFKELLSDHRNLCYLHLNNDGTPSHPLYLPADLCPKLYDTTREWLPPAGGPNV